MNTTAKSRVLDLFRKIKSEKERETKLDFGSTAMPIEELFLDSAIEDSQLRMIFTACSPFPDSRDQMASSLKTVSEFSTKKIVSALLIKEKTIKKRLSRARKTIAHNKLKFEIPTSQNLTQRRNKALSVIYLIFNEGGFIRPIKTNSLGRIFVQKQPSLRSSWLSILP
ncbi:MAG: hypothetical protein MK086_05935 [Flavobacteriales bacterium]|nr:hypothetical protein [Flavobacteriales bacterium]